MDRALPMDYSDICSAFEKFSTFLELALLMHAYLDSTAHYLAGLLFSGQAGMSFYLLAEFHFLPEELSVPLAHKKS